MKFKRRRAVEVPPKIKSFINGVITTPLENIEEPLKGFVWEFDKGDFHHWVDLFNHFDTFFEKHIKTRKDLQFEDNFLESDPPFPREAVLQILRVVRIILENCTNKHFYSSYEKCTPYLTPPSPIFYVKFIFVSYVDMQHHLSSLLASIDADVVEARLLSLVALCQDRSCQPSVLTVVTSGGHHGILSSLMQKAIDSIVSNSSKC
ncbi:E3 ubiquitin-protein ligase UPL1 [Camellia lanceoleosa]|uniref:E3 ubiquitin-protein ligase UPL1 n=1 Tax=Camellia lanceoleosa TaxID=1840588 RepID=A0ACC0HF10_9ERIC|nr:E3 ubiquitin-protein ligase UPL1 [Camellia lanceoleosa]